MKNFEIFVSCPFQYVLDMLVLSGFVDPIKKSVYKQQNSN
jgi:hypothetical protein